MIRRASLVAIALLLLAGCGTREVAALQGEVQRLRAERDRLAKIAEHLDEHGEKVRRLQADHARLVEMGADLDHPQRVNRIAAIPGLSRKPSLSGGTEFTGTTPETLVLARRQAGFAAVERLALEASGGWTLTVPSYDPSAYESAYERGVHLPAPTPAPGRFGGRRARALRGEIEALQREILELEALAAEVTAFEPKKRELEIRLGLLQRPSRLHTVALLAEHLFLQTDGVCRSGNVTIANDNVRFFCAPRTADADTGVEALRARFADADAVGGWSLGPLSIDPSNPEPIQGSLLRKK